MLRPSRANASATKDGKLSSNSKRETDARPKGTDRDGKILPPLTQANFEHELRALAEKAAMQKGLIDMRKVKQQAVVYARAMAVLLLAAVSANLSQLMLAPVYGAIPSTTHHRKLIMIACFAGWSTNLLLDRITRPFTTIQLLPVMAWCIPVVQYAIGFLSGRLETQWGPLVVEALTLFPLTVVAVAVVATTLEKSDCSWFPSWIGDALPGFLSYGFYTGALETTRRLLSTAVAAGQGRSLLTSRLALQTLLATVYSIVAPSKLLLLAVLPALHTALLNPHLMTGPALRALQSQHQALGWRLLDRAESLTGYLSVIENVEAGFRVMRCDHSLLGGEWTKLPVIKVAEPVYSIFALLEAVRLVETSQPTEDAEARALVIGLGIGTTPAALIMHGIDTTIVEIDPVVYEMAQRHFHLPTNHTAVIEDATVFARERAALATSEVNKYDYIIHDVFTGGAEPVDLFTLEFIQHLSALLKDNGVIAINYAGDLALPGPGLVYRTVRQVFPSCRVYRDSVKDQKEGGASGDQDFTNMVIFCTKSLDGRVQFRSMMPEDTLGSKARQGYMMPQHEIEVEKICGKDGLNGPIVRQNETGRLSIWHGQTAAGHWQLMRTVIPDRIWEMW